MGWENRPITAFDNYFKITSNFSTHTSPQLCSMTDVLVRFVSTMVFGLLLPVTTSALGILVGNSIKYMQVVQRENCPNWQSTCHLLLCVRFPQVSGVKLKMFRVNEGSILGDAMMVPFCRSVPSSKTRQRPSICKKVHGHGEKID